MVEVALITLLFIAFFTLVAKRTMTYLHVLQQEDYSNPRLRKWMFTNKVYDRRLTLLLIIFTVIWIYSPAVVGIPHFIYAALSFVAAALSVYLEKDPRKSVKKKLVATDRAKRLFFPAVIVMLIFSSWVWGVSRDAAMSPWPWILLCR